MNKTAHGIVLQITQYGETSVIAKILTQELGVLTFIYKGVRKKNKSPLAHLLFPGAILSIELNHFPHKNLHFALKTHLHHPYFITQESVVKNCIMVFLIEVIKNLVNDAEDNTDLYDIYIDAIDLMHQHNENECANLPIFFLIKMSEISGYRLVNNYTEQRSFCDIENGEFTLNINKSSEFHWHRHIHFFLSHHEWEDVKSYPMNRDERKLTLELYMKFLQLHQTQFQQFKSLDILSTVIS